MSGALRDSFDVICVGRWSRAFFGPDRQFVKRRLCALRVMPFLRFGARYKYQISLSRGYC